MNDETIWPRITENVGSLDSFAARRRCEMVIIPDISSMSFAEAVRQEMTIMARLDGVETTSVIEEKEYGDGGERHE